MLFPFSDLFILLYSLPCLASVNFKASCSRFDPERPSEIVICLEGSIEALSRATTNAKAERKRLRRGDQGYLGLCGDNGINFDSKLRLLYRLLQGSFRRAHLQYVICTLDYSEGVVKAVYDVICPQPVAAKDANDVAYPSLQRYYDLIDEDKRKVMVLKLESLCTRLQSDGASLPQLWAGFEDALCKFSDRKIAQKAIFEGCSILKKIVETRDIVKRLGLKMNSERDEFLKEIVGPMPAAPDWELKKDETRALIISSTGTKTKWKQIFSTPGSESKDSDAQKIDLKALAQQPPLAQPLYAIPDTFTDEHMAKFPLSIGVTPSATVGIIRRGVSVYRHQAVISYVPCM